MIPAFFGCWLVFFQPACKSPVKTKITPADVLDKVPFQALTDSIRRFPSDASLYTRRAGLLSQHNLPELACLDFKKSWELAPGEMTAIQYASSLSILDRLDEELSLLVSCQGAYPASREINRMLGEAYVQSGRNRDALNLYDSVLKKAPGDFESWYEKGLLLSRMKDTSGALQALRTAYTIQPTSTYGLELAHLYAETNNDKALPICDLLLKKDSARELIDPFFIKGIYYSNTKNYDLAVTQFDSCIRRDWKFTEAYIEKGIVFFRQKNYDVALNTFRMAATVSNTYPDAYFWIGRCYEATGKNEEAIEYYQRALSLDRGFSEAKTAIKRLKG